MTGVINENEAALCGEGIEVSDPLELDQDRGVIVSESEQSHGEGHPDMFSLVILEQDDHLIGYRDGVPVVKWETVSHVVLGEEP